MAGREKSLRGQVFDKIRSDILKGRYQQGDELVAVSYTHLTLPTNREV